jgi:hypothetical protein
MAPGSGFTVIGADTREQPEASVYVTLHVPALMPAYVPDPVAMVPMVGQEALQVPPVGEPVIVSVLPSQTCATAGVILVGNPFTSITVVRAQPVASE